MNQERNNEPVGVTSNIQRVVERPRSEASEKQKQYYLERVRLSCLTQLLKSPGASYPWVLPHETRHIINMLTCFWRDEADRILKIKTVGHE